jgi:GalNAc-alpha-(1->4)-GalNAc-alpha-(1->3)-diNAcBac-PP-undecaprenol alpha-1,4-N-acetyl-D-galactosaminyltransferase
MDMRITAVISGLAGGGGAARVCVNLANAWVARGHHVTILTVSQTSTATAYALDERVERCSLDQAANSNGPDLMSATPILRCFLQRSCPEMVGQIPFLARLRHALVITKADVVVAHIDLTNLRVLAAMHETGIPVVACEHTDASLVSIGEWQKTREVLYRRAHAVVALHPAIAQWFRLRGARSFAIPNPLNPPDRETSRRKDDRHRLITLTRLSSEKRIDLLVRAFATIAAKFPEWDLEIYGDGPLHAELSRLIDKMVPGRAYLRGFTNDPYAALARADLFALTSWVEGFPCAVWEALACGVPVVAMDCGVSIRSLVRDGVDGLIVPTRDALEQALSSLMSDERLRNTLAMRAGEVVKRLPAEESLKAWDTLLSEVTLAFGVAAGELPN